MSDYRELLETEEWKRVRNIILKRDRFTCQECHRMGPVMHVHHKYYRIDLLPWEYDASALVTLCEECHFDLHRKQQIPILDESGHPIQGIPQCDRCSGVGYIPCYSHVQNGICFGCWGVGRQIDKDMILAKHKLASNLGKETNK